MYAVNTPEVIVLNRVKENPDASARLDRMMNCIEADQVIETDDEGLAGIASARGWHSHSMRTGQHRMDRSPAIIFDVFQRRSEEELSEAKPGTCPLKGGRLCCDAWGLRDSSHYVEPQHCVCQTAWEIHCASGCLHACDYCHVWPCHTIMLNLEELAGAIRAFGETIPWQNLYKFDNMTDTICLEPEYGASEIMVNTFANWPGRYVLLYTKSDNVEHLLDLRHNGHTLISWSVSCETASAKIEKNTPSPEDRIRAIERCQQAGYTVRVRLSPICPIKNWREENRDLIRRLLSRVSPDIISIDVLGWMDIPQIRDGMDLSLFEQEYVDVLDRLEAEGFERRNAKHVWPHEMREEVLRFVIEEIQRVRPDQPVSICMETPGMWRALGPLMGMEPANYACCCGPTSVPGNPLLVKT